MLRVVLIEGRARRHDRRALAAVERIHDQHGVARLGEALAHLAECRSQAEMSGHTSTAACAPLDGCTKYASQTPSGVRDLDFLFRDGLRVRRLRQHHRQTGAGRQAAEVAARDAPGAQVFLVDPSSK